MVKAELDHPAAGLRPHRRAGRIVNVENRVIVGFHESHGAGLELEIALEGFMPVEMIWCHVQDETDPQPRVLDGFQLKAAQLEHHPIIGMELVDPVEDRLADVAAPHHLQTSGAQDLRRQRGRGGLAVGARDAGNAGGAGAEEEIDLTGDFDAALARGFDERLVPGHSWADHHKVGPVEVLRTVATEAGGDPGLLQLRAQFRCIGTVDDPDGAAPAQDEGRGGASATTIADHERVSTGVDHVPGPGRASARASTAATREPVQNQSASGVSRQPATMKWLCKGDIRMIRFPVSLKLATCAITETVSTTKTRASSGRYQRKPVVMAAATIAVPSARLPVSPMNKRAGNRL